MRPFVTTILLFAALLAFAGDYFERKYEVQLAPKLGWSSWSGYLLGVDAALLIPLSDRWQWKTLGGFTARTKNDYVNFTVDLGPIYNFGDDWSRAWFVGGGVGYGNEHNLAGWNPNDNRQMYGFLEGGKRLPMNKSGTLTWIPQAKVRANSFRQGEVSINPLNFAYSF